MAPPSPDPDALAQNSSTALLTMQDICVELDGHTVLRQINLQIKPGEIVTIVGPNGSGKTSLLRSITGALPIRSGTIERPPHEQIGYLPQTLQLGVSMPLSVGRFLRLPVRHSTKDTQIAIEATGIGQLLNTRMQILSGGQVQRVLLARAIIGHPKLLLLDEPTRGLDPPGITAFYALVVHLRERMGCAVLMVSHDLHVVMRASDRVICLNRHICCEGTPETVSSDPEYQALFGDDPSGVLALYHHHHDHKHDEIPPTP